MDTIFMNSQNSITSDSDRLLLNLSDKIKLKRGDKYVSLSNLSTYYKWKTSSPKQGGAGGVVFQSFLSMCPFLKELFKCPLFERSN